MNVTQRVVINPELANLRKGLVELSNADMREMVKRTDQAFRKNEVRLFSTQGSSGGKRWANLSKVYAKAKRASVGGKPVLVFSGALRKAASNLGGEHVARFTLRPIAKIELGLSGVAARIGGYHQEGNVKLPRRDPIQMTRHQADELHREIRVVLIGKLRAVVAAFSRGAARARAAAGAR